MIERAIRNNISRLIAIKWESSDRLAVFAGLEKMWGYQSLELRIACLDLSLAIHISILTIVKRIKTWMNY